MKKLMKGFGGIFVLAMVMLITLNSCCEEQACPQGERWDSIECKCVSRGGGGDWSIC